MVRPVWHAARHSETDTSETLQSDVMRFMAILALCLVAIFALVQSLPLRPVEAPPLPQTAPVSAGSASPDSGEPATPAVVSRPRVAEVTAVERLQSPAASAKTHLPATEMPASLSLSRQSASAPEAELERSARPVPEAKPHPQVIRAPRTNARPAATSSVPRRSPAATPSASPGAAPAAQTPLTKQAAQSGLSLRFSSDEALLALVAQRRVQVYAWAHGSAWRLSSERGALRFTPADPPKRFHQMTSATVPREVALALTGATSGTGAATWGVVLPADIGRRLVRLTQRHTDGTLLIQADGRVRMQRPG